MRVSRLPILAALLAGCVTAPPPPPTAEREPFPGSAPAAARPRPAPAQGDLELNRAELQNLDPKAYAARFDRPFLCEEAARRVLKANKEKGWSVLKACVAKGNFTALKPLSDGTWDEELRTRPDSSTVILQVVAARGGDVQGDLDRLRKRKVPLFDLGAASEHPEVYKGRMLLLRAEVGDVLNDKGKITLRLVEKGFSTKQRWMDTTDARTHKGVYGTWYSEKKIGFNEMRETGLQALARLKGSDPFLVPGRDFLFLARFDGVRETDGDFGDNAESTPVVSIVTYIEPASQIVE
jgi:hypothetical protein